MLMAATHSLLGSSFHSDCKCVVDALHRGVKWATGPRRPLARLYAWIFAAMDDTNLREMVSWIPAH